MINKEHHAIVLERLGKTIELAKALKTEQFNYSSLVAEFDFEHNCGTVCCIAGWYPAWELPDFEYHIPDDSDDWYKCVEVIHKETLFLEHGLRNYHQLATSVIYYLFLGSPYFGSNYHYQDCNINLSLKEVIARFEEIYELVLTDKLDNSLYYEP